MAVDTLTVLSSLRQSCDEKLAPLFFQIEDLWERKLWHQLTDTLVELYRDESSAPIRKPLFERFVAPLSENMNQLAYVGLGIKASEECSSPQEALDFLNSIGKKVDKDEIRDVHVYLELRIASIYVQLNDAGAAKKILDRAKRLVDDMEIADPVIAAAYYGTACEYFKSRAAYSNYYRHALLYLACIDHNSLTPVHLQQRAYDLAVAALLGDSIYNFGELILHPILEALDGKYSWLRELILAVNYGNITRFQELKPELSKAPLLAGAVPFLEQKICLMALCECVFKRATADRTLSFDTIAKETHLQVGAKVEVLVMKAFSIGLLRGSIDQVSRLVSITWLQPRILDKEQVRTMRAKVSQWDRDVENLGHWMQTEGRDVWSAA